MCIPFSLPCKASLCLEHAQTTRRGGSSCSKRSKLSSSLVVSEACRSHSKKREVVAVFEEEERGCGASTKGDAVVSLPARKKEGSDRHSTELSSSSVAAEVQILKVSFAFCG